MPSPPVPIKMAGTIGDTVPSSMIVPYPVSSPARSTSPPLALPHATPSALPPPSAPVTSLSCVTHADVDRTTASAAAPDADVDPTPASAEAPFPTSMPSSDPAVPAPSAPLDLPKLPAFLPDVSHAVPSSTSARSAFLGSLTRAPDADVDPTSASAEAPFLPSVTPSDPAVPAPSAPLALPVMPAFLPDVFHAVPSSDLPFQSFLGSPAHAPDADVDSTSASAAAPVAATGAANDSSSPPPLTLRLRSSAATVFPVPLLSWALPRRLSLPCRPRPTREPRCHFLVLTILSLLMPPPIYRRLRHLLPLLLAAPLHSITRPSRCWRNPASSLPRSGWSTGPRPPPRACGAGPAGPSACSCGPLSTRILFRRFPVRAQHLPAVSHSPLRALPWLHCPSITSVSSFLTVSRHLGFSTSWRPLSRLHPCL